MNFIKFFVIHAAAITSFSLLVFSTPVFSDTAKKPMVYRYWDLGASPKRDEYQFSLLKLTLEKTLPTHGKYELLQIKEKYTSMRSFREISRGEIINIAALPYPTVPIRPNDPNKKIMINVPIIKGLLGYRKLVVRKEDLEKFEHIKTADELKALSAGQGRDWEDIAIYKYNGYRVVDNADFYNLFAMLAAGRFDYIPLGVFEVDSIMEQFSKYSKDFVIVPDIVLYYPFPVLFNVSINEPQLAERIKKGLAITMADGSFNQLFELYFHDELIKLKTGNPRVFTLASPNIPDTLGLKEPDLLGNENR